MLFLAALMFAQPAAPAAAVPARKPTAKVECRLEREVGSRIPTKICRLDKEWELLAKDAQDDLRNSRNSHGAGLNSGDPR